jgi:hypothetical protein
MTVGGPSLGVAPVVGRTGDAGDPADAPRGAGMAAVPAARAPLLLVHAGPPWQANGGSVFLDVLAAHVERPCVHLSIALDGHLAVVPETYPRPVHQVVGRGGMRGMGVLARRAPWLGRQLYWGPLYPSVLEHRTRAIAAVVTALRPRRLVFFLNAVEVPLVARALIDRVPVPYATMEWDVLDDAYERLGLTRALQGRAIGRLAALRAGAAARGVASEGMAAFYRRAWNLDALVLRQPVTPTARHDRRGPGAAFVIAVCGNVYAGVEFRALLAGLDRLGWSVGGRPVVLRVIGEVAPEMGPLPDQVTVTGWLPYAESLARLGDADLGYCPYWFDPAYRRIVSTSFPSKLISYLSCGVPVLYHGPREGTPAAFLARYPAGFSVHSLDASAMAAAIDEFGRGPGRAEAAGEAAAAAVGGELSSRTLRERLAVWLGEEQVDEETAA